MSRWELTAHIAQRDARLKAQDAHITELAAQVASLMEFNEHLVGKLAQLEHLLSRNAANSSMAPSKGR